MRNKNRFLSKVAVLSVSLVLTSAGSINGALPLIQSGLKISNTEMELLSTAPALSVVVFVLLSAFFAEKIGIKRTISIGLLLVGVAGGAPLILKNYPVILASRFLLGAGFGLINSLAVSIINMLFDDEVETKATMQGFRGAAENVGNAVLTILAGLLLAANWHMSFAIYLIAFPILAVFWIFVPDVSMTDGTDHKSGAIGEQIHIPAMIWVLAGFALLLVMMMTGLSVRFSSMAVAIKGPNFNASNILAAMPIIGIITGSFFGLLNKWTGRGCLYIGIGLLILANLLVGFSGDNFTMLLVGYVISGIPGSLVFPFIYNSLNLYVSKKSMAFATSLILIGCNLGGFLSPFGMNLAQTLSGSSALGAPFPVFTVLLLGIALVFYLQDRSISKKAAVSGSPVNK
ncbi:transporter, major facilitator family protein [Lentilactobacillus parafarraginis F0439]|uniref:Transporter, major facilitator family protein n=1 Tax=Lentilactobacillus parafarraginis F0439 TaxID=797515 RepID=G9ZP50_9LACO|nr:MFS transporter [Lentilactobacillus parafarraginis]EHL98461.1 transporter, major facilitator family protein [Lentilactobacillus parafarraginis F0439]